MHHNVFAMRALHLVHMADKETGLVDADFG